jgi:hypothetical protein
MRAVPVSIRIAVAAVVGLASSWSLPAHADVSSWLAVGGGYTTQRNWDTAGRDTAGVFTYSIGVGSSPLAPFVVGVVYRGTTMPSLGTDVGAALRLTTGGFSRGNWGLALDAGAAWRSWGSGSYGRWPLQGVITLGAPFGLQLAVGGEIWSIDAARQSQGAFVALELDLLRMTLMRRGVGEQSWPNPNPPGGKTVALAW